MGVTGRFKLAHFEPKENSMMPTFTMPDRIIRDDGTETPRDSGMPVAGHSQADCLMRELGDLKAKLSAQEARANKYYSAWMEERTRHEAAVRALKAATGKLDPQEEAAMADARERMTPAYFDLLASRGAGS